jgi:hypothetical protein
MIHTLRFYIGLMRFFRRIKPSYESVNSVCTNPRSPSFTAFKFRHPQKPRSFIAGVCSLLVLNVARRRYITEIAKRVIARVAVNVINIARGPCAGHVKPCQPIGSVTSFVDPDSRVSFGFGIPSDRPRNNFTARFDAPSKATCFGIVAQQRTQLVKCDVEMAHAVSLS